MVGSTETDTVPAVHREHDTNDDPTGVKVSDSTMAALDTRRADFHGNRNDTLLPTPVPRPIDLGKHESPRSGDAGCSPVTLFDSGET